MMSNREQKTMEGDDVLARKPIRRELSVGDGELGSRTNRSFSESCKRKREESTSGHVTAGAGMLKTSSLYTIEAFIPGPIKAKPFELELWTDKSAPVIVLAASSNADVQAGETGMHCKDVAGVDACYGGLCGGCLLC